MDRPGSLLPQGTPHSTWWHAGVQTGVAALGLVPALALMVGSIVGVAAPGFLVNRALVVGGLLWAAGSSLVILTHWEVQRAPGEIRLSCTVRKRLGELVVLLVSLVLLLAIGAQALLGSSGAR